MADYKGKLNLIAEKVYLGNTYGQITADEEPSNILCEINIPNIKNVGLERFDVKYVTGRTSGTQDTTRPYYIWTGDRDVVPIQFPNVKEFTWIIPDDMGGILGISDVSGATNYLSSGVFADMYNNTYPHYDNPYRLAWAYDGVGQSNGMSMKAKHAYAVGIDKNVNEFHGLKSDTTNIGEGYIISPYSVRTLYGYSNYSFMSFKSNGDLAMVGRPLRISESYGSPSYTRRLGQVCRFDIIGKGNTTRTVRIPFVYHTGGGIYLIPSDSGEQMSFFTFLIDDDMQLWFMTYSLRNVTFHTQNDVTICITKVDNVVEDVSYGNGAWDFFNSNVYYVDEDQFGSINEFFLDMLSPEKIIKAEYDDGGPDIGEGNDPYGDLSNAGSSVGGKDVNTEKDLHSVNTAPNTDYDRFAISSGLFGAYVLEPEDLQRYTKTLSNLYNHSSDILAGEACQAMADRLENNVTSLIMLPLEVSPSDYTDTIFSLGNTGVMGDGTWTQYVVGNNWARANYLTKFTKIIPVPIGTINHNYDNFLDFAPYSTASLFIPYIGKVELPINLIQSTTDDQRPLRLEFRVNYTSGDFVVILFCTIHGEEIPIGSWNGNCAREVKVSVDDDSGAIRAGANRLASMVTSSMINTARQVPMSSGGNNNLSTWQSVDPDRYGSPGKGAVEHNSMGVSSVSAPSVPTSVTTSQHMMGNGSVTGELGFLGSQMITLTVERPVWWKPYDYGNLMGYPTKKIAKLSSLKGFAKISSIHVRCSSTASEKEEIASLLSEGVIF